MIFGGNKKTGKGWSGYSVSNFIPGRSTDVLAVVLWLMVDLEADDAFASTAHLAATDSCVKVCIWTPDKDLAQCVRDDRIVKVDY